jgi:hypothetical protein
MTAVQLRRLQRCIEHLHSLGPWALAHFLAQIAEDTGTGQFLAMKLQTWLVGISREAVVAAGADRFPPYLVEVPACESP